MQILKETKNEENKTPIQNKKKEREIKYRKINKWVEMERKETKEGSKKRIFKEWLMKEMKVLMIKGRKIHIKSKQEN